MKYGNILYLSSIGQIGGIETWLYNISELYKDLDLTVVCERADKLQLQRLKENVRVIVWDHKTTFECVNLFTNIDIGIISFIKAEQIYIVLHADYEQLIKYFHYDRNSLPIFPKCKYIGVSKQVCDSWKRVTGFDAILCYNPILPVNEQKALRICSAQRMSAEKGKHRIEVLAEELNRVCMTFGYKFIWDIYTNDRKPLHCNNVYYRYPCLDITDYYNMYDIFVSLSSNEAYCYSVVENLVRGIPCVVTDLPVYKEIGLNNRNSITLNLDMSNVEEVALKMFDTEFNFIYSPPEDDWRSLFADIKSTYDSREVRKNMVKVVALDTYTKKRIKDSEYGMIIPEGFKFQVSEERLEVLLGKNEFNLPFVKVLEEPKEEVQEKPKRKSRKKTEE